MDVTTNTKNDLANTVKNEVAAAIKTGSALKVEDAFIENKGDIYARALVTKAPGAQNAGEILVTVGGKELQDVSIAEPQDGTRFYIFPKSYSFAPAPGQ